MKPEDLLDSLNCCAIPVDLEKICAELQIRVEKDFFWERDHSGEIHMEGDEVVIWIDPTQHQRRRRFTLAHEIGHYINDFAPRLSIGENPGEFRDEAIMLKRDGRQDPREYRANDFAARLLMPKMLLMPALISFIEREKTRLKKPKIDRELVFIEMSNQFEVSKSAMEIRLMNLGVVRKRS